MPSVMTLEGPNLGCGECVAPLRGPHGGGGGGHGGGGHGGGGHGGGGHGGGFHPRGGGGRYWYGGGPYYYGPDVYVVDQPCPNVYEPVLASDGLIYDNACLAVRAGHTVVRRVDPSTLRGLGASQTSGFTSALVVLGLIMAGGLWIAVTSGRKKRTAR